MYTPGSTNGGKSTQAATVYRTHRGRGWSIGALENTRELQAFGQWCLV